MNAEMFGRKSVIFVALAVLQITKHTSALTTANPSKSYSTVPLNVTAGLGDPAKFWCGVPKTSEGLTFTFYGSAHNYTLSCPSGHIKDIPQALEGLCIEHLDELLAGWALSGTSIPDNGSKVVCQRKGHPAAPAAYLHVYDNGSGNALLIGLAIGGFFGVIIVFGLLYLMLTRSERLQICFRGKNNQPEDLTEIVDNIEPTATSQPTLNGKMRDL